MPFDQKKINGPENTFSYKQFIESDKDVKQANEIKEKRKDGRKFNESRKVAVQMNAISKAKGSCYIENGNTKLVCGVFELREISRSTRYNDKGQLYCDFKYAPFSRESRKSLNENDEKLMSTSIKSALESVVCLHEFPNYQIDIFILVLEDDGAVLSTAIMATGIAFIDACIPCFDMPTSSTVAFCNGKILVDPTADEEEIVNSSNSHENHGTVSLTSLNSIDQVAQVLFSGFIEPTILKEAKKQLLEINKGHEKYLRKVVSQKIVRENSKS